MTADDERLLRRAIELSAEARISGNPPFGSLLVGPDGVVLAEERNTSITDADITAHPELKLARWAAATLDAATAAHGREHRLQGARRRHDALPADRGRRGALLGRGRPRCAG